MTRFGIVRQGIAENPSWINNRTNKRFGFQFNVGDGVFSLKQQELLALELSEEEATLIRQYHELDDLDRFHLSQASRSLIYSTKDTCPDIDAFPRLRAHLEKYKIIMMERRETKKGSNSWWHLHWPRDERIWQAPKVLCIQMSKRPSFVPASNPIYVGFSVNAFVPDAEGNISPNYFAGILNSRLLWKWFQHNAKKRGVNLEINGNVLNRAPIYELDFNCSDDVAHHDRMVELVQTMLDLNRQLHGDGVSEAVAAGPKRRALEGQIAATDRQIDELVYELYGLTDEEIAIVDEATA